MLQLLVPPSCWDFNKIPDEDEPYPNVDLQTNSDESRVPVLPSLHFSGLCDDVPITFGKYRGMTPNQIAVKNPGYIVWAVDNVAPERLELSSRLYAACKSDPRYTDRGRK